MARGKRKYPIKFVQQLAEEFVSGATLDSLSKKYEIPSTTVVTFYRKYNWKDLRKRARHAADKAMVKRVGGQLVDNTVQHLEISRICSYISLMCLSKAYEKLKRSGGEDEKAIEEAFVVAERAVKLGCSSASIQRNIAPQAQEEAVNLLISIFRGEGDEGDIDEAVDVLAEQTN